MPFGRNLGPVNNSDWWLHDLFGLVALLIVVIGVVLLVRMLLRRSHHQPASGNWAALHELDLRYARGEVQRNDYLQRRADLSGVVEAPAKPETPAKPKAPAKSETAS